MSQRGFHGGGLVSYSSIFYRGSPEAAGGVAPMARPTFSHEGNINFMRGFYKNFDLAIIVLIVTNHFLPPGAPEVGRTGLGDMLVLAKYRFYRHDSRKGPG